MMLSEIDTYLRQKNKDLDSDIEMQIRSLKEEAIRENNEPLANALWCYECIYNIQQLYINAYHHLLRAACSNDDMIYANDSEKSKEYEFAWNLLDRCENNISFLEKVFCITDSKISNYHIEEILEDIKKLQPLFPYKYFFSRELVIKEQRCSICDKVVSVRHPCHHTPGKLYMGKLCARKITKFVLINVSLVTTPFDKYAIVKAKGQRFNFKLLDELMLLINPYSSWSYTVEKRLLPQYQNIKENEKCPCGSGMKYEDCIIKSPNLHYELHYEIKIEH